MKDIHKALFDSDLSNDALSQLLNRLKYSPSNNKELFSLVGIGCRYPGGINTPSQLYDFLKNRRSAIDSFCLRQRFATHADENTPPRTVGAFLDNVDLFDPLFFGISPKEAREIDPQHRLAMLAIWEALEDAGIAPDSLRGKAVGVFIASASDDYQHLALADTRASLVNVYTSLGTSRSSAAGRVA